MGGPVPIYILAGGRSSRFGADKARALVEGRPLLTQVATALKPVGARVTVVADREGKYADLGLPTIVDRLPDLGPLAGLHAALGEQASREEGGWLLLTACDWVGLSAAWVELLLEARGSSPAVAFRGDLWEPLLALYHVRLLDDVAGRLREKRLALWRVLDENAALALPLPADWGRARQVNRPEDLQGPARAG